MSAPTPTSNLHRLPVATALPKDLKAAATDLGPDEARFMVDTYYQLQDFRIASNNQVRSLVKEEEPHATIGFFAEQFDAIEAEMRKALDTYSAASPLGQWARANHGIGPVLAAALLCYVDVTKAPYASSVWKYAGLAQSALDERMKKGEKRTWNADFKVICWRIGDQFVKHQKSEKCYYGHLYAKRKELEVQRNESGANAETAQRWLDEIKFRKPAVLKVYGEGRLPDSQIDNRARRYAVKRFLSHYWEAAYRLHYGKVPPHPYVHQHMGHTHVDAPPVPLPAAA
jgi:hypothetical protein